MGMWQDMEFWWTLCIGCEVLRLLTEKDSGTKRKRFVEKSGMSGREVLVRKSNLDCYIWSNTHLTKTTLHLAKCAGLLRKQPHESIHQDLYNSGDFCRLFWCIEVFSKYDVACMMFKAGDIFCLCEPFMLLSWEKDVVELSVSISWLYAID